MEIVGLTGGIASGKSFVINYLKKIKIPTHESDKVIQKIYKKPNNFFITYLKKNGFEQVVSKKIINKDLIRKEIFTNKIKKKKLEIYLHKEVKKSRDIFLKKNKKKKIVFLDIPLLFENKLQFLCNFVCSTVAPIKIRQRRALQRKGMNTKIFKLIIKNQTTEKIRIVNSDYMIDTSKTKNKTYIQVNKIIYDILNKKK